MYARKILTAPPQIKIPFLTSHQITAQTLAANGAYETPVFTAFAPTRLFKAAFVPLSTLTGAAAGATVWLNLWRAGVQLATDGALGGWSFLNAGLTAPAQQGVTLPLGSGTAWTGTGAGVTGGTSTGDTLSATGGSALAYVLSAQSTLVYDPGLATQETIPPGSFTVNTGTGVVTLNSTGIVYNGGKFASTHLAGGLVVVPASYLYIGSTAAITGGTTATSTLTARGAVANTNLGTGTLFDPVRYPVVIDPGLATQEVLPVGQWTLATNTLAPAATYNGGKFATSHASGATAVIPASAGGGAPLASLLEPGDVVTVKWKQGATGLALPESSIFFDYGIN